MGMGILIRQIAHGRTAIVIKVAVIAYRPSRACKGRIAVSTDKRCRRSLGATRNRSTNDRSCGFLHHGSEFIGLLTWTAAVFTASLFAVKLHHLGRVVRKEHARLKAVVEAIVFLNEIVHITIWLIVGKMTTIVHPRRTLGKFVVTRVVAFGRTGRRHDGTLKRERRAIC